MERGKAFGKRAGAFFSDLQTRIAGGEDPSFDDPDWVPEPEAAPADAYYAAPEPAPYAGYPPVQREETYEAPAYAQEPYPEEPEPSRDYSYYARPQPPVHEPATAYAQETYAPPQDRYAPPPPVYEAAYGEAAYDPYADPGFYGGYGTAAPAPPREEYAGEWYGPENMPRPAARPRKKSKPGDFAYAFWSIGIVLGMMLTVVSFIYGCVV